MLYLAAAALVIVIVFFVKKSTSQSSIFTKFGLSEPEYKILSSDLGGKQAELKLSHSGVNGIPDVVFAHARKKIIVVGEYKSRKYRGFVKMSEFYQLMIYIGHLKVKYPEHVVIGRIGYPDGHAEVHFDPAVYSGLIGMSPQLRAVKSRRLYPDECKPLHRTINVHSLNRKLKLRAIP